MKTNPATSRRSTAKRRRVHEVARDARFWLDLRASYEEAKVNGISLEEATRRLEAREAAEKEPRAARARTRRRRSKQ